MTLTQTRIADFTEVPVIDIGALVENDEKSINDVAVAISSACEKVGFLYIKNHGIDERLRQRMFQIAEEFFAQPEETMLEISVTKSNAYRGYVPMLTKGNDTEIKGNLQEAFQIAMDLPADDPDVKAGKPLHGQNQWPKNLPHVKKEMTEYYNNLGQLAKNLLRGFAIGLDIPPDHFHQYYQKPLNMLRLLHYPEQEAPDDIKKIGTRPHCDAGGVTILMQDNTGGLEVQNKSGDWVVVPPIDNTFVVNIGNIMMYWTNGRYTSTPHRVINRYGKSRISVPFFANPDYDATIQPLDTCVPPGEKAQFEPINAGEHLLGTYRRIWPGPEL
jgi:isopenicillin N synthase-like dioxygenase